MTPSKVVVDDVTMVAERNAVERPRALLLALHGGTYDARYWNHPAAGDASLLVIGEAIGFSVIAVDRPGNGRAVEFAPDGVSLARQVDVLHRLIDQELDGRDLPAFVIGHSLGGVIALMMAADVRGGNLSGIDVAGIPIEFTPDQLAMGQASLANGATRVPAPSRYACEAMFYGSPGCYDPAVVAWGETEHSVPTVETREVFTFADRIGAICGAIHIPTQITIAEHERSSHVDLGTPDRIGAWFANNHRARLEIQRNSGHNISLHHVGRAYHLRAFAFFEECMATR